MKSVLPGALLPDRHCRAETHLVLRLARRINHLRAFELSFVIADVTLALEQLLLGHRLVFGRKPLAALLQFPEPRLQQLKSSRRHVIRVIAERPLRQFAGGQIVVTFLDKSSAHDRFALVDFMRSMAELYVSLRFHSIPATTASTPQSRGTASGRRAAASCRHSPA